MKQILIALLAIGFVASAAALPAQAQASYPQQVDKAVEEQQKSVGNASEVDRGPVEKGDQPVRRGPPAFVQDLVPEQALQNMPDFFW